MKQTVLKKWLFKGMMMGTVLAFSFTVAKAQIARDTTAKGVFLTIHDRPYIAALPTPEALCAGENLVLPRPETNYCGSDSLDSSWKLGGVSIAMPYVVKFEDNGKMLTYWAKNSCGDSTTVAVKLTVQDHPTLAELVLSPRPGVLCVGTELKEGENIDVPAITDNGTSVTQKGWLLGGEPIMVGGAGYTVKYEDRLKEIRYYALNRCSAIK